MFREYDTTKGVTYVRLGPIYIEQRPDRAVIGSYIETWAIKDANGEIVPAKTHNQTIAFERTEADLSNLVPLISPETGEPLPQSEREALANLILTGHANGRAALLCLLALFRDDQLARDAAATDLEA